MKRNINEGVSLMMKDIYLILAIVFFKKASSLCDSTSSEVCKLNYNKELPYVYDRHPSIDHSSSTDDTKYCDLHALQHDVWYRSSYNLITECVDHRKCGTSDPIWLNGSLPADTEGTVDGVGCVKTFSSCCESTIALKIRNCTYYMVYCFLDLHSSCHSRFCLDTDLSVETTTVAPTTTVTIVSETTESSPQEVKDPGKFLVTLFSFLALIIQFLKCIELVLQVV
ncbi:uncharacterized protein LOC132732254 [Ruditapes philippinarum]|uniref:uncharacterized protein LOC132732254 n=1 Tax=Ruditapes philippinarum TaxID=129788 RepID=UPI00295B8F87|nr:uncharacterized protein LOC132732254 [Ruditapes philippinarum]